MNTHGNDWLLKIWFLTIFPKCWPIIFAPHPPWSFLLWNKIGKFMTHFYMWSELLNLRFKLNENFVWFSTNVILALPFISALSCRDFACRVREEFSMNHPPQITRFQELYTGNKLFHVKFAPLLLYTSVPWIKVLNFYFVIFNCMLGEI